MARSRKQNWRCIKSNRNYTIDEITRNLGVAKGTVRRWVKSGKLPAITDKRPALILGADLVAFHKRRTRPKQKCRRNECYCLKCRKPKIPAENMVDYVPITLTSGNLRGLCPECCTLIHRRISLASLPALEGVFEVTIRQADDDLTDSANPSINDNLRKEPLTHAKTPSG